MPKGKARVGKIRTKSSAKKRFKMTSKGKFKSNKAAHNHLLQQKAKRQKRLFKKTILVNKIHEKMLKQMIF